MKTRTHKTKHYKETKDGKLVVADRFKQFKHHGAVAGAFGKPRK